MILVSMERGDPTLYHGTKQSYSGPGNFKFIRRVVTTPLVNHVTKTGLVGRGLIDDAMMNWDPLITWWKIRGHHFDDMVRKLGALDGAMENLGPFTL